MKDNAYTFFLGGPQCGEGWQSSVWREADGANLAFRSAERPSEISHCWGAAECTSLRCYSAGWATGEPHNHASSV